MSTIETLQDLLAKRTQQLADRTDNFGNAKPGFRRNVAILGTTIIALKYEIENHERLDTPPPEAA